MAAIMNEVYASSFCGMHDATYYGTMNRKIFLRTPLAFCDLLIKSPAFLLCKTLTQQSGEHL